jgi:hypothetical protein
MSDRFTNTVTEFQADPGRMPSITVTDPATIIRTYAAPLTDCPPWCAEHASEVVQDEHQGRFVGDTHNTHRRVIHRHFFEAQRDTWPSGVRTLTVESSGFGRYMSAPQAVLTFWPDKPNESSQMFSASQLRELIKAANAALVILEETQR